MSTESLERALQFAYRYLGRRDRTVAEAAGELAREGDREADIDARRGGAERAGLPRRARLRSASPRTGEARRLGQRPDRAQAREVGVAPDHVAAALADQNLGTELQAAVECCAAAGTPPADDRERERALGFLVRKGYDLDLAYDAVRKQAREKARGV